MRMLEQRQEAVGVGERVDQARTRHLRLTLGRPDHLVAGEDLVDAPRQPCGDHDLAHDRSRYRPSPRRVSSARAAATLPISQPRWL